MGGGSFRTGGDIFLRCDKFPKQCDGVFLPIGRCYVSFRMGAFLLIQWWHIPKMIHRMLVYFLIRSMAYFSDPIMLVYFSDMLVANFLNWFFVYYLR